MRSFLFCFICLLHATAYCQDFFFQRIGTAQTLPSETYQILQDSKGYVWFTTDAGICRFDGKKTTTFTTDNGLSENVVFWLSEDRKGRIWCCTLSGNFFYYENEKFNGINANDELKKIVAPYIIASFFIGENDTLYCTAVAEPYVLKVAPQDNYKKVIKQKIPFCNLFMIKNKINDQTIMGSMGEPIHPKDGTLTFYFSDTVFKLEHKERRANSQAYKGTIDSKGTIYLPTSNMIIVIDRAKKVRHYYFKTEIISIKPDQNGDLWVGTAKDGGYFYKNSNLDSKPIHFLSSLSVSGGMVDREGTVWICTLEKGVFQCKNKAISYLKVPDEKIPDLYKTSDKLYFGTTHNNEIVIQSTDPLSIKHEPIKVLLQEMPLTGLIKKNDYSYYATKNKLFYISHNKKYAIKRLLNYDMYSKKMIETGKDSFLLISNLNLYLIKDKRVLWTTTTAFAPQTLAKLKNKKILIGFKNNEGIFELKNNSFYPFLPEFKELKIRINDIKEDARSNIWIATNEKGIYCYSEGKLICFNEQNGLISNKVNTVDFDNSGNAWIATNKGLSKINFADNINSPKITNFNESNGLPSIEIDLLTFFKDEIWCTANECIFHFYPDKLKINAVAPLININAIHVNGFTLLPTQENIFDHTKKNIDFEFSSSTFKNSQQKEYIYRLEGYDNQWKHTTIEKLQYTNLSPGYYTFYIFAFNNDKIKSITPASFTFTIKPPFWMRGWFLILEIIAILALVYCAYLLFARRMKAKEERRILVNKKIADFQLTAVRAQMNPHFIFNAISSIQHYILKNDIYQSYNYLAKFSLLIRNVLENSKDEYITLAQDIHSIGLYIELEKIRFKEPFRSLITVDQSLDPEDTFIPTMLIQPYVENAIWHGLMPKQDNAELLIDFAAINNQLQITIKDNGVGSTEQQKRKHNSLGMSLIEKRLQSLEVKNQQQFSVRIKYLKDDMGNNTGTEVLLIIPIINF